jgi:hypothetical protein
MILNIIYSFAILVCVTTAILNWKALKAHGLFLFIPYLLFVFIQEMTLMLYTISHPEQSNAVVYNLVYRPLTVIFYGFVYYQVPFNSFKKAIFYLTTAYLCVVIITFAFFHSIYKFNHFLYLGSGLILSNFSIFFLLSFFKIDDPPSERKWLPMLWITIGIAIYCPVVSISFSLYNYLYQYNTTISGVKLYQLIPKTMSLFMYGCFTYAFYLCKKKTYR